MNRSSTAAIAGTDRGTDSAVCVPLGQLGVGTYATIRAHELDASDADDLRAMGLRPSCRLRICKRGEPCIVSVNASGCRIALTGTLASRVLVQPD